MTTNTEALRAQFEKLMYDVPAPFSMERDGDGYWSSKASWAWACYQAGHAAGVAAERERCAQVCLEMASIWLGDPVLAGMSDGAEDCADAIRAAKEGGEA